MLNQLLRSFLYRDKNIFKKLYTTYVRPHLEFSSPSWSPWLSKDIDILEEVQIKFVKNVTGLQGKTYNERLLELGLLTLKDRRVYLDLVEAYKIIYGISCQNPSFFFKLTGTGSRRNTRMTDYPRNIVAQRCKLDIRKYFFTNRVVEPWNDLPCEIKDAPNVNSFKHKLKRYMTHLHSGRN